MDAKEIELSDDLVEEVQETEEYDKVLEAIRIDYEDVAVADVRGYDGEDRDVNQTVVFSLEGIEDCSFGSMAFGLENETVTKASGTLHFDVEDDESRSRIRDYRYLHEDEMFYRPMDERITENEHRLDGVIEVLEYYQDRPGEN